jgi:hypothetical protein
MEDDDCEIHLVAEMNDAHSSFHILFLVNWSHHINSFPLDFLFQLYEIHVRCVVQLSIRKWRVE